MQKQSRLMQMQKHQNNCNGVAWWCHFSKTIRTEAYNFIVNAGKENFTKFTEE
jgi:hypothetical protein